METKICNKCNEDLPLEMFNNAKRNDDGLYFYCKKCVKKQKKLYRERNKEKVANQRRISKQKNRVKALAYQKQYRANNIEKYKEIDKRNKEANKEKYNFYAQTRRTKKRMLPSTLTLEQWINIKNDFDNKCAYCGRKLKLTQEHFIPLSKDGEFSINNIIPACSYCNCSKGAKDFFKWYPEHKYFSKDREIKILKYLNYKNKNQQLTLVI